MATKWIKLKDAEGKSGVRYREHQSRKHGIMPDRYYVLTYWYQGKTITEAVGWSSEKCTPTACFNLLAELKHNQRTGQGPCTLAELRAITTAEKEAAKKATDELKRQSFKYFFDNIFLPEAKTRWKPQTTEKAVQHVKNWIDPVTEENPMREIGLPHINQIKTNLAKAGRSPRMMQYVFRTFSMVWNAALDHGYVSKISPTKSQSFRLPKIDNERQRYLNAEEETKLLEEILKLCKQSHDMAITALDSGLRFGEIASLTWDCIDFNSGSIRVLNTKSGRDRIVPMTSRLKELFQSCKDQENGQLIFPNAKGNKWSEAPKAFRSAIKKSGINNGVTDPKMKVSFHTLRHTYASRLVQAGVDLYRVQRLLGHSTPVMTQRYSKLNDGDLKRAVEAMEQDKLIQQSKGTVIKFKNTAQ